MVHDEYDVESKSHKALISIAEDKSELCPIDHAIQCFDGEVTDSVFDNYNYPQHSDHSGHSNKNPIIRPSQVEQHQPAKMVENNQKQLDDSSLCSTKGNSFYTDKQYSNLETAMNSTNISEISNDNYDVILGEDDKNNLPEQTVLYIMTLMFNNIYLRLINNCNNTLYIAKKHKVKVFNSQDIENKIEQFEISRENISTEFNNLLIEQEPGVQYKNIFTLLDEQPELLFAQVIDLQNSLKEFELLFCDSQDISGTIKRLQKCINIADTLLLSHIEQVSFKDINAKNTKKPFDRLMNLTSVANMLCDSLAWQDVAGASPQYFRELNIKVNKIQKVFYTKDFVYDVFFDFHNYNKYIQVVNSIFSDNTLCLDTLDKIQTNIRNYTTRDTFDLNQKPAANADIKFLFVGMKFIVERIYTMIEPYFKPQDVVCNSNNTKQQDINNKHYSINNAYMRINTQYSNKLPGLNTNTLKDQNPINMRSTETENTILHVRTRRSTDSITDTAPLSNENASTDVIVDTVNNDSNDTLAIIENKNSTLDITQDTTNDLISKVNTAANTNIQAAYTESKIEQEDRKEHLPHRANINVNEKSTQYSNKLPGLNTNTLKDQNPINMRSTETENTILHVRTRRSTDSITDTAPLSDENASTDVIVDTINNDSNDTPASIENKNSTLDITQDTTNDLISKVNTAANTNVQATYTESKIEQEDHKEHVPYRTNINVKASYLASTSERPQKIMITSEITSTAKKPSANTNSAPKKYTNLHPYSTSLADIVVRHDIVTTFTFISITHKYPIHGTINDTGTVQLNSNYATYHNDNINNSNNRTHHIPITCHSSVNTVPVVNVYNEASITNNTTTIFWGYNIKTLNNNDVNYIIGDTKLISNNLARRQLDNLMSYNGTAIEVRTSQHQQLYYNTTLSSNVIYCSKLLNLSNFVSSYKSSQHKEERFEKRACDKILIDHTGFNITKDSYPFLDALNYGHKLFDLILTCTKTYQELHKQYPNKSIKELLLTSSLINSLDADERKNLTNIYISINTNILGLSQNTEYAQKMPFCTKLQPLILRHEVENSKHQIAYGIDGLAIDMQYSKLQIDDIEQDITLRTASIPTYIDPRLGIKSISLAFTDSFGHMPLESEALYMAIHYDNTGNIVAFHCPPTMEFIGKQPVIRTLKGNYFGPCTRDTLQQLERHISANESHNSFISDNIITF